MHISFTQFFSNNTTAYIPLLPLINHTNIYQEKIRLS